MKKIIFAAMLCTFAIAAKAQYGTINAILQRLEEKRGMNQNLEDVNIDNAKFILIKEFDDHTERDFIIIQGNKATYVEVFDDKQTGKSTSNVFSGDIIRSRKNIISLRADFLEGRKIGLPITKNLLMTKQKKILYLVDINTRERWIEESAINKK